jgi:hypothetical protein
VWTLFFILLSHPPSPLWEGYADPVDYLHQSRLPILSKSFWMPEKTEGFYPRPFTVPLFYKFAGSDPEPIIQLQKFVHALSIFLLAAAVLPFFRNSFPRYIFLGGWYLLMLWWNILGWSSTLLSESLSASLLFIWLASFLYVSRKQTWPWIFMHALVTVLFSFTRDSWPYVLICFYGLYTLIGALWEKPLWRLSAEMLAFSGLLVVVQQYTATVGQRYRLPVMNNIVLRVLPHPNDLAWFERQGMPDAAHLKEKYNVAAGDPKQIYPLYSDPEFSNLSTWIAEKGNRVYLRFLLTHPESLFLLRESRSDIRRILAYNFGYIGSAKGISLLWDDLFPVRPPLILLLLILFLFVSHREQSKQWVLPMIVLSVFSINAWLLYLADSMEVERHEYISMTMVQFIGLLCFSFLLDSQFAKEILGRVRKRIEWQFPREP